MSPDLDVTELQAMVRRVFQPGPDDRCLAILVDLPDEVVPDTPDWKARRTMATQWWRRLAEAPNKLGLEAVQLVHFRNTRANNADLPEAGFVHVSGAPPAAMDQVRGHEVTFANLFETCQIFLAPTQFSLTAPLKRAATRYRFRAATMPGFSQAMIPALRLDYARIASRVDRLKALLDDAIRCDLTFRVHDDLYRLSLDLRHRKAHASSGVFPNPGTAGNLPSGEAYIVPYEGEHEGDPSRTAGTLPVQLGEEVILYRVEENVAVQVLSRGTRSEEEARKLEEEPAYGNLAELGLGVLGDFGLEPSGEILLDEKLGLHIAFGRSEHFGGRVGPDAFSRPDRVVHIDRVYVPSVQPRVIVEEAHLVSSQGAPHLLMARGEYRIDFNDREQLPR